MVVCSNKHSQRHMKYVSLVSCVECYAIAKVLICSSAACIGPENVFNCIVAVYLYVIEKLIIDCLHVFKERYKFQYIIQIIFPCIHGFPANYMQICICYFC